jgi:hypothetical protein
MMQEMFRQTGALGKSGVTPQNVSSLRQAAERCVSCSDDAACRKWLDFGIDETEGNRDAPGFCPNQALQNEMKLNQSA